MNTFINGMSSVVFDIYANDIVLFKNNCLCDYGLYNYV